MLQLPLFFRSSSSEPQLDSGMIHFSYWENPSTLFRIQETALFSFGKIQERNYPSSQQKTLGYPRSPTTSSSSSSPKIAEARVCFPQYHAMGQVLDRLQGKQWRRMQIRKITDKVFDRFKNETGRANLRFEDVYIGVLLVYNDINKRLPGPHFDPPSKDSVRLLIQEHDINLDGEIDREEFAKLIKQITADTFCVVSQGLIVTMVAAPTIAILTKKSMEGVPHVGKVVQRIPTSVYASLLTLVVMAVQQARKGV